MHGCGREQAALYGTSLMASGMLWASAATAGSRRLTVNLVDHVTGIRSWARRLAVAASGAEVCMGGGGMGRG
ncbi:hypothetical protein GCM10022295_03090 [Streptomyces osmaniensis]|uniref:Secreted protein n=1 Tax=Streptomyces osmaniensis TaxID=593134 RepID=A0ABP6V0W1_9ACTN